MFNEPTKNMLKLKGENIFWGSAGCTTVIIILLFIPFIVLMNIDGHGERIAGIVLGGIMATSFVIFLFIGLIACTYSSYKYLSKEPNIEIENV